MQMQGRNYENHESMTYPLDWTSEMVTIQLLFLEVKQKPMKQLQPKALLESTAI